MKTYKIITGRQETELVQADQAELDSNSGRLNLYLDEELVASYVGYSSFNVLDTSLVFEEAEPTP